MISIGTCSQGDQYPHSKAKNWSVIGWLNPLIDMIMSGNSKTVHYELNQMFGANDPIRIKSISDWNRLLKPLKVPWIWLPPKICWH